MTSYFLLHSKSYINYFAHHYCYRHFLLAITCGFHTNFVAISIASFFILGRTAFAISTGNQCYGCNRLRGESDSSRALRHYGGKALLVVPSLGGRDVQIKLVSLLSRVTRLLVLEQIHVWSVGVGNRKNRRIPTFLADQRGQSQLLA